MRFGFNHTAFAAASLVAAAASASFSPPARAGAVMLAGDDTISAGRPNRHEHRRGKFKMNARRQAGRKVCPPHRKGRR